jgi:hypothetical protein
MSDCHIAVEDRFQALCDAKRILGMLSGDRALTSSAQAEALTLSELHPTADLVELVVENPWLSFARWRRCLIRTQSFISVLATFHQGSDVMAILLMRLAHAYPSPRQITLMCYRQTGYASRLLRRSPETQSEIN